MTMHRWTLSPGRTLGALGVALAVAVGGCADSKPDEEVRTGQSAPVTGLTSLPTVPSDPTSTALPSTGVPVDTAPPATHGGQPPAGGTLPPLTTIPGGRGQPQRWEGYTVGPDGVTLTFTYYAGVEPCSAFESIVADESADAVRVTIYERPAEGDVVCILIAQLKSASVTLAAPLGGRTVIDGAA